MKDLKIFTEDDAVDGVYAVGRYQPGYEVAVIPDNNLTTAERAENARRIVACVNACTGYPTPYLEDIARLGSIPAVKAGIEAQLRWLKDVTAQRDELLAALEELLGAGQVFTSAIEGDPLTADFKGWEGKARAAIARAKGGAE